ncbi:MAG: hypothetical protein WBF42_18330 [Terracidiphilus sp.]
MKRPWWQRPLPSAAVVVALWLGWRLAFLSMAGIPAPMAHDEFSYLLGADTFAHGRLSNPPHPLAKFFESPHELVRPTYASKYPPGQAMFLALGQVVLGDPFYGVLAGNALMLFAICVMLFAWVSPGWAWAASVVPFVSLAPKMYWADSYWGGSVAAAGGALVLLAIGICRNSQKWYAGMIFAAGALLLFWTRPYEGGVFTLAILLVFGGELWRKVRAGILISALLLLAAGAIWTGYDNKAVTGSAFRLPYLEHDRQYNVSPIFWIEPLRPQPVYDQPRLAFQHGTEGVEADDYREFPRGWRGFQHGLLWAIRTMYLEPTILLTLILPFAWRNAVFRKLVLAVGIFVLGLSIETFHFAHYAAPGWGAFVLIIAIWAECAWRAPVQGFPAVRVLAVLVLLSSLIRILMPTDEPSWGPSRSALIKRLSGLGGPQLVIVRYPNMSWNVGEEWVYNGADIDRQRVVFAHDLGAEEDRKLLAYYPDRKAWLLTFDVQSGADKIQPYNVQ